MAYLHTEIKARQTRKHPAMCGDAWCCKRTAKATTVIVADGIGSGIRAGVAAQMCISRLSELMDHGFSTRDAFHRVVETMNKWRDPKRPYAAFAVLRIRGNGETTYLGYDFPAPVLMAAPAAEVVKCATNVVRGGVVSEAHIAMDPGDGIMLFSDGVTEAGLGNGLKEGWQAQGVAEMTAHALQDGAPFDEITGNILEKVHQLNGDKSVDDATVLMATCRQGRTVNLMTGPPADPRKDREWVRQFMRHEGRKIVCGATTANVVAKALNKSVQMYENDNSVLAPPSYEIPSIDLVTEGAVTLTQLYNVWDADPGQFSEESGVTRLHEMLSNADCVRVFLGNASNPANSDIAFRQRGVLSRQQMVPLLCDKLREAGKLVILNGEARQRCPRMGIRGNKGEARQ